MRLTRRSVAGTLESSDVYVEAGPGEGLQIEIRSVVEAQFGGQIRRVAEEVLRQFDVTDATVSLQDRGALDCTIRARVETAVRRAGLEE